MGIKYCTVHGIGYNPAFDPVCPQCSVNHLQPGPALEVDLNPTSVGFGRPMKAGQIVGDPLSPKVV